MKKWILVWFITIGVGQTSFAQVPLSLSELKYQYQQLVYRLSHYYLEYTNQAKYLAEVCFKEDYYQKYHQPPEKLSKKELQKQFKSYINSYLSDYADIKNPFLLAAENAPHISTYGATGLACLDKNTDAFLSHFMDLTFTELTSPFENIADKKYKNQYTPDIKSIKLLQAYLQKHEKLILFQLNHLDFRLAQVLKINLDIFHQLLPILQQLQW